MITTLKNTLYALSFTLLLSLAIIAPAQAGSEEYENDANNTISDVEKQASELRSLMSDAREANIFTSYAEDELEDAEDLLVEAKEEKDDEDWEEALRFAQQAYALLEDAIDDLVESLSEDAVAEKDKAKELFELAKTLLDDTDKGHKNYDDAEAALDESEDYLEEAEDEFDDEEYDASQHFSKKSYELSERVFSELKTDISKYMDDVEEEKKEQEEDEKEKEEKEEADNLEDKAVTKMTSGQKAQLAQINLLIEMLNQIKNMLITQALNN